MLQNKVITTKSSREKSEELGMNYFDDNIEVKIS